MTTARRSRVAARLLTAGLLLGSLFGSASSASAQTLCQPGTCGTLQLVAIANPDLTVSVAATPNPVVRNGTHTYTITVSNITWAPVSRTGLQRPIRGQTANNVRVHLNAYPSNERMLSWHDDTGSGFICYTPPEYFGMDVRCVAGTVPSGGSAQITLTMQAPSTPGAYAVTSTVDPYAEIVESNESNNTGAVTLFVN
jgi:hypothetical protein